MSIEIEYVSSGCKRGRMSPLLCDGCGFLLTRDQDFFIIAWHGSDLYRKCLCPTCLNQLHNITAPLQILVTTGKNTQS